MELVALSGGVCPLVLAFSCSVVAAQLCQFSIFRLCYRFTSLFLTSTSAPSLSFLVLLTCSLFFKKLPLALTLWSSASLCFEPVFFSPLCFLPWPWLNEWLSILWLGPLIHSMTLKLATPLLFSQRSTSGSQPSLEP